MSKKVMGVVMLVALAPGSLLASAAVAQSRNRAICFGPDIGEARIAACTRFLGQKGLSKQGLIIAHDKRGWSYSQKGEIDLAIADFGRVIKIDQRSYNTYNNRGNAYVKKGDNDLAVSDYTEAIRLNPRFSFPYNNRGSQYYVKGDHDRALADYDQALRLDPKYVGAYLNRGSLALHEGRTARALADFSRVGELQPRDAFSALWLDIAQRRSNLTSNLASVSSRLDMTKWPAPIVRLYLGQLTSEAVLVAADHPDPVTRRGQICEANFFIGELALLQGRSDEARRLFQQVVDDCRKDFQEYRDATAVLRHFRNGIAASPVPVAATAPSSPAGPPVVVPASGGKRVALVIGNAAYKAQSRLTNPTNDAADMEAALSGLGFRVQRLEDAGYEALRRGLQEFAEKAQDAEMAVVFFAGHGVEVGGENYLVPVDASLRADRDVHFEAVPLRQVLATVSYTRTLGLVILDACRNDPFRPRMTLAGGGSRSALTRGLSRVEPSGNVLVAYAAREGTAAADGSERNSPFTKALLRHIATPDLDVNFVFRRVREEVRKATDSRQEPAFYGSLGGDPIMLAAKQ